VPAGRFSAITRETIASARSALLGPRDAGWLRKVAIAVVAAVPIVYWMFVIDRLMPVWPPGVSVPDQIDYLIAHPLALPRAMVENIAIQGAWLARTLVGIMGWLDTPMPSSYYWAAAAALAIACMAPGNSGAALRPGALAFATVALIVIALCGALYITWTPVAAPSINGLQGRYLLPVLPLLAWGVPGYGIRVRRWLEPAWWPVLLFPLVTFAVMPWVIVERYYGSWSGLTASLDAPLFRG